jgi:hypothetical protein
MTAPARSPLEVEAWIGAIESLIDNIPDAYQGGVCFTHTNPREALKLPNGLGCALCYAEKHGLESLRQMVREQRINDGEWLNRRIEGQLAGDALNRQDIADALGLSPVVVGEASRKLVSAGRLRRVPAVGGPLYALPAVPVDVPAPAPTAPKAPSLIDRVVELLSDDRLRTHREIAVCLDVPLGTARGALERALAAGRVVVADRVRDPRGGPARVLWTLPGRTTNDAGAEVAS